MKVETTSKFTPASFEFLNGLFAEDFTKVAVVSNIDRVILANIPPEAIARYSFVFVTNPESKIFMIAVSKVNEASAPFLYISETYKNVLSNMLECMKHFTQDFKGDLFYNIPIHHKYGKYREWLKTWLTRLPTYSPFNESP